MGLDSVELVMKMEEAFGIELKDEEVEKTVTPRMVIDLIYSQLQKSDEQICHSQRAFYVLRKAFMKYFNLKRKDVTPDMPFSHLIPPEKEQQVWNDLKDSISPRRLPELIKRRTSGRFKIIFILIILVFIATVIGVIMIGRTTNSFFGLIAFLIGIPIAIKISILIDKAIRRFTIHIPDQFQQIRDLVPYVMIPTNGKWIRELVADMVKRLTIEQVGLPEEEYREDARFHDDMGVD